MSAHRNNRRAVVNWAAGITLIWMLANMLYLPAVNHLQSYRATAAAMSASLPQTRTCVAAVNLGDPQRAMLDYFAGLRFVPIDFNDTTACDWLVTQGGNEKTPMLGTKWQLVWEGSRPRDELEQRLRLYRR